MLVYFIGVCVVVVLSFIIYRMIKYEDRLNTCCKHKRPFTDMQMHGRAIRKPLTEGCEKRGGVNPIPTVPKPNNPPPAQPVVGRFISK